MAQLFLFGPLCIGSLKHTISWAVIGTAFGTSDRCGGSATTLASDLGEPGSECPARRLER